LCPLVKDLITNCKSDKISLCIISVRLQKDFHHIIRYILLKFEVNIIWKFVLKIWPRDARFLIFRNDVKYLRDILDILEKWNSPGPSIKFLSVQIIYIYCQIYIIITIIPQATANKNLNHLPLISSIFFYKVHRNIIYFQKVSPIIIQECLLFDTY
jgi:hypothetical protein